MTRRVGNVVIIEPTADERCDRCGEEKECRDVLGDGTSICFHCATEPEKQRYSRRLFGDPEPN